MFNFPKRLLGLTVLIASAISNASNPPEALKKKFSNIGNVKEVRATQTPGMYAWMLEKNGKTLVLYNTPDNKFFIKGSIYELDSKRIISNQDAIDSLKYASLDFRNRVLGNSSTPTPISDIDTAGATGALDSSAISNGYMNLKWDKGAIPEALSLIDGLKGTKEGKGQPQDTLYVFYDPSCVWCHRAYDELRPYVKKGYTIKWLPTVALGRTPTNLSLASAPLQNPSLLSASFDKDAKAKAVKPTEKNISDIETNMGFLVAYFNKVMPEQNVSVPLALFLDKTSGKVTHIQGLSDKPVIDLLYGDK